MAASPASKHSDAVVRGTNEDAQVSKLSCVNLGYFEDAFLGHFIRKPSRRSPLINRGYYSRHAALQQLLNEFLERARDGPHQVLSLGAGWDTTWFNLQVEGRAPTRYIEVDFLEVTQPKVTTIISVPEVSSVVHSASAKLDVDGSKTHILSDAYCLLPADLRNLEDFERVLQDAKFDYSLPTYILSECVLVYMEPRESSALVSWLGQRLETATMVIYEQIKPDDPFGRQMLKNLENRGCCLRGLRATPTLEAHQKRLADGGWKAVMAWDMDTIYREFMDPREQSRISKIEIFDEFEEWHMIQEHYCIAVGVNDEAGMLAGFGFQPAQKQGRPSTAS